MLQVYICMSIGALLGLLIRNRRKLLSWIEHGTLLTIFILLFLMGIVIGNNQKVILQFSNAGITALYITIASVAGSIVMAWILYKIWVKTKK